MHDADGDGQSPDDFADEQDEPDESVVELPGDEAVHDPDEVERLVFGGKDFTQAPATTDPGRKTSLAQRSAQARDSCRTAVAAALLLGPSSASPAGPAQAEAVAVAAQLVDVVLAAVDRGWLSADPEVLSAAVRQALKQFGGPNSISSGQEDAVAAALLLARLEGLLDDLVVAGDSAAAGAPAKAGHGGGGGGNTVVPRLSFERVAAGALRVPHVLSLPQEAIRERVKALAPLLGLAAHQLPVACSEHPELLVAPLEDVRRKMLLMRNTMGLTGEAAVQLLTPYMFDL